LPETHARLQSKPKKSTLEVTTQPMSLRAEIERRMEGQRLTPAHRRIVQCLIDHAPEIGFLSSMELAELANVSQPSVSRFALALGFDGFLDMRRCFRAIADPEPSVSVPQVSNNRYQTAAATEAANLVELSATFSDLTTIKKFGKALASSRPLPVLGLRASTALAKHFCYFAAKVHHDIRPILDGGSLVEDLLEQAYAAGATWLLVFLMPLYPRETIKAIEYAKQLGLKIALVSDSTFSNQGELADLLLTARINSNLVFDSSVGAMMLISVLLDAMCDAMPEQSEARLEYSDRSSTRRKVFVR
jgi:DNA-binding MurR/RpiR family transcriptional regulator